MASSKKTSLTDLVELHVRECFRTRTTGPHLYHNMDHTVGVVDAASKIGKGSGLAGEELENVLIAAWMHDIAYHDRGDEHEKKSAEWADTYLKSIGLSEDRISAIRSLIMATKMPTNPITLAEKVICDADMSHLGSKSFMDVNQLLRAEKQLLFGEVYSDRDWFRFEIDFVSKHHFHTPWAETNYQRRKTKNLLQLTAMLNIAEAAFQSETAKSQEKEAKALLKETKPDPGSGNHVSGDQPEPHGTQRHGRQQGQYHDFHQCDHHILYEFVPRAETWTKNTFLKHPHPLPCWATCPDPPLFFCYACPTRPQKIRGGARFYPRKKL